MQSLYEWDFKGRREAILSDIVDHNVAEFAHGEEGAKFIRKLILGTISKLQEIDMIIEKAAPQWPIDQIAMVDRAVLRIGIYELLFGNQE